MDMNGFDDTRETLLNRDLDETSDDEAPSLESENDFSRQIRELRLQLERLEAFQRAPKSNAPELADAHQDQEEEIELPESPALSQQPRRWRTARIALALVLTAILAVAGYHFWNYLESYQDTDDAQVDGYLDPISSRINGTINAVYVDNNQSVKAGQLLVQLDPSDYQVALEQARAQLAQAEADLNSARQQYVSAGATVHQDEAQNYLAQRNAQRYSQLIKQNIVSQSEFDQYDASARAQDAAVKRDQAAAGSAERTIASKEAMVKQAQANLDQAGLNLSYTRIVAPADGIIGNRSAQLGQRVQPGQSLMALTQHQFWVTANFKETQLERMRPGQPVTIHVDATARDFKGHVEHMPGATGSLYDLLPPENATGNYVKIVQRLPVRILFDHGQDLSLLRPGMSVEPKVWLR
jgi:membrane fusion protein (multidrug efflux system)